MNQYFAEHGQNQLMEEDILIYEVIEWCLKTLETEVDEACRYILLDILSLVHKSH